MQRPDTQSPPFVSLVMAVRNEGPFIAGALDGVVAQDYPRDRLEVIVADGMSNDATREVLAEYCQKYPFIRQVDNVGQIVSTGLNAAIDCAQGDLIMRLDGHAEIASDYISQVVRLMGEHPDVWSAGGPIVHAGKTLFGQAVAVAMSHPLGIGMATHRLPDFEGYVEGAQFPTFRRWVFDRVGKFDENLVRNQDDELNYRIAQAGGKIYVSPRVRYVYYVRGSLRQLYRQYFQYGFWRIPVMRKHKRPTTPRQMVPLAFYAAVLVLLIVGAVLRNPIVALALPAVYLTAMIGAGLAMVPRKGLRVSCLVPVAIATIHLAYAMGMLYGFWCSLFNRKAWDTGGSMSKLSR